MQKTWTDLLGSPTPNDKVDGRYIVRELEPNHFKVLWSFDNHVQALRCFEAWVKGEESWRL